MINGKTVLGVIPARGGSKRCPGKNIKLFLGKPLIAWTIEEAKRSKYIDNLIISTDCPEIASVSQKYHFHVLMRPPELATDEAPSEDVLRYHLKKTPHDWAVLLQPTSPLRMAEDIDACLERAQMGDACISINRETGLTNGALYVCKMEWLNKYEFRYGPSMKYVMPESRSLDINVPEDFL